MRTSDKSLMSMMGFQDPDRTDPVRARKHDLAVMFLMKREPALGLLTVGLRGVEVSRNVYEYTEAYVEPEFVAKRSGGFVVGFVDLILEPAESVSAFWTDSEWDRCHRPFTQDPEWRRPVLHPARQYRRKYECTFEYGNGRAEGGRVAVEVKTRVDDPGSAVRQVKLYADTVGAQPVIVAAEPTQRDSVAIIQSSGVAFVQLGAKFAAFCDADQSATADLEL